MIETLSGTARDARVTATLPTKKTLDASTHLIEGETGILSGATSSENTSGSADMSVKVLGNSIIQMRAEATLPGEATQWNRTARSQEEADFMSRRGLHAASASAPFGYHLGKRIVDIVGASFALIVLSPLFLLLFILIRIGSPGPIFHRRKVLAQQDYDGASVQTYDAFKFRTMIVNADEYLKANPQLLAEYSKDYKLSNDPRVTRVGAPLRRLSLDELPQLLNILRGQMSLVGPRMISPPELEMYGADSARLLSVKPGLTGLWQVSGRTNLPYQERVHLDMFYIENRTLLLDLEILIRTVGCVLARRGAV